MAIRTAFPTSPGDDSHVPKPSCGIAWPVLRVIDETGISRDANKMQNLNLKGGLRSAEDSNLSSTATRHRTHHLHAPKELRSVGAFDGREKGVLQSTCQLNSTKIQVFTKSVRTKGAKI